MHWKAFSWMCSLCCLLKYYQNLMRDQEGIKIELQKKVQRRICVRDIIFLTTRPAFYVIFCCFLRLLPFPYSLLAEWS